MYWKTYSPPPRQHRWGERPDSGERVTLSHFLPNFHHYSKPTLKPLSLFLFHTLTTPHRCNLPATHSPCQLSSAVQLPTQLRTLRKALLSPSVVIPNTMFTIPVNASQNANKAFFSKRAPESVTLYIICELYSRSRRFYAKW